MGKVYTGRVVNITKFGAFVNILPGRDGLVHISKLGRGKRINSVEDVLSLGDEIEVRVEEIDDRGKVSLVPVGDVAEGAEIGDGDDSTPSSTPAAAPAAPKPQTADDDVVTVSFEEAFDDELRSELGDLGPASTRPVERDERGGDRSGDRGGRRRRHR
jgi:polyribonucleotide nucleotidyltransferase